ncbi:MAG TPA: beta-propeller fold lactonase family protein [Roseiarcus sp.]|jgi:6-phosphogluconolactonase
MTAIPFLVGSYSVLSPWAGAPKAHGAGIVIADLDTTSGAVHVRGARPELNPSFLVRAPAAGLLWAITECEEGGELVAFREHKAAGQLDPIGRLATGADAPCHLAIDSARRFAFVAHYHGGMVSSVALDGAGRPDAVVGLIRPPAALSGEDRSAKPPRPHASLIIGQNELLVTDTGRDLVLLYRIVIRGPQTGAEFLDGLALPAGTGPRHLAAAPRGAVFYVSNQNSGGVSIIERVLTPDGPRLALRGILSAQGLGRGDPIPSEIAVHPTWNTCYLANRTDNSLSIFLIDPEDDRLQLRGAIDVMGRNPRHFAVAPGGEWLVVANQDSDELTVFHLEDGGQRLTWTGQRVAVATPTIVAF